MELYAVSDAHLDIEGSQKDEFNDFLDYTVENSDEGDALVLVGDILDLWRNDCVGCSFRNSSTVEKIKEADEKMDVHYVVGNHDHHYDIGIDEDETEIRYEGEAVIDVNGTEVMLKHGHQFDPLQNRAFSEILTHTNDYSGEYVEEAWEVIQGEVGLIEKYMDMFTDIFARNQPGKKEVAENMDKAETTIDPGSIGPVDQEARRHLEEIQEDKLIFGHTHDEFVSKDNKMANTGAWIEDEGTYNTFVKIDGDGEIVLKRYLHGGETEIIDDVYEFN